MNERPPVNDAARQALALGAVLSIAALTIATVLYLLHALPPL